MRVHNLVGYNDIKPTPRFIVLNRDAIYILECEWAGRCLIVYSQSEFVVEAYAVSFTPSA